jgi:hypothetical protein
MTGLEGWYQADVEPRSAKFILIIILALQKEFYGTSHCSDSYVSVDFKKN